MKIKPIKIVNNLIPILNFSAMTTLIFVWVKKKYLKYFDEYMENHEGIHVFQQLELAIVGTIFGLIASLITSNWWWMFLIIGFPIGLYIVCWIIELILPPYDQAYKNICFESEAQYNEGDLDYLNSKRKLLQFRFFKYISNKKYPYLTKKQRILLHKSE